MAIEDQDGPVGFDLDLTLIDSRSTILDSFAELARATGVPIDLDAVAERLGLKLEDELTFWFGHAEIAAAARIYRSRYVELAALSTSAMVGAAAALAAVVASGVRTVIITAKHESSVAPCLRAAGLAADEVFAFAHGPEKAEVLRMVGASAYVGDTPADMQAGLLAGVTCVGVTTGSFDEQALVAAGATTVLSTLEGFPAWYGRFRGEAQPPIG